MSSNKGDLAHNHNPIDSVEGTKSKGKAEDVMDDNAQYTPMPFKLVLINDPGEKYERDPLKEPVILDEKIDNMIVDDEDITVGSASKSKKKSKDHKCPECQRIYKHRNSLVYHMRSHTGERPYLCEVCGKSFSAASAIKSHMQLHSGEKPYKCDYCDREFRLCADLKFHIISIHSDIRQYQCEFCGKNFARKYSLTVHRRIHTGEKNYKCEFCEKCFRTASYLQNHRRMHTGVRPCSCPICGKPFRNNSDVKRHLTSHNSRAKRQPPATQISEISNEQNVETPTIQVTASNANPVNQVMVGPQIGQQIVQVQAVPNEAQIIQIQETQLNSLQEEHILEESGIIGDLAVGGTPINITLPQHPSQRVHSLDEAAAFAVLQSVVIQDGQVSYPCDGSVTIRDTNTGTIYVWPLFIN